VTTGEDNEGKQLLEQVERIEALLEDPVKTVTYDAGYAHGTNYAALEARNTDAVIPPQKVAMRKKGEQRLPARRFKYDARKDLVKCPAGKHLHPTETASTANARTYRAHPYECRICPLRARCFSPKAKARTILLGDGFTALLRARRRKEKGWDEATREKYKRHRWRGDGVHGRAKTHHGLRRAAQRGLANVRIQAYLTAAAMNLKCLVLNHCATTACRLQALLQHPLRQPRSFRPAPHIQWALAA
jgi:hypothetical protein